MSQFSANKLQLILVVFTLCILSFAFFTTSVYASMVSSSQVANSTGSTLKNGLVGWWTFDGRDTVNGVAKDESISANNGKLNNIASSTFYSTGKIGQAFNFDGVNDFVSLGTDAIGTGASTISMWIYPHTYGGSSRGTMIWGNSTRFRINATGARYEYTNNGFTNTAVSTSNVVKFNTWTHVLAVRDSSNLVTIYLNGVQDGTARQNAGTPTGTTAGNIGDTVSAANRFDGKIDDVRVYNRALTPAEVKQLYNQGSTNLNDTNTTTGGGTTLRSGLIGWWTFDGVDLKTNVADRSGSANTGYLQLGTTGNLSTSTAAVSGVTGQSLKFDGVDDRVAFSKITTYKSISIWFKINNTSTNYQGLVSQIAGANSASRLHYTTQDGIYSNTISAQIKANTPGCFYGALVTSPLRAKKWYHLVISMESTRSVAYLNGVISSTTPGNCTYDTGTGTGSNEPGFGRGYVGGFYLNGLEDDVRIYNRALTAAEVKQLYNQGSTNINDTDTATGGGSTLKTGLVGWWTFDGPYLKTNVADTSGQGNNGSLKFATLGNVSTSSMVTGGKTGQALKFDGIDDYITLGTPASLTSITYPYTLSIWFKTKVSQTNALISFDVTDVNSDNTLLLSNASGGVNQYIYAGNSTIPARWVVYPTITNLSDGRWHNAITMRDSANNAYLYVDGISFSRTSNDSYNPSSLNIGARANGGSLKFNGTIDDVRVYNRVLSASEVKQLYNLGK